MGFDCALQTMFRFTYRSQLANRLYEHELDHVLVGRFDGVPRPHPTEAEDWCWVDVRVVAQDAKVHPERYTTWFPLALERLSEHGLLRAPQQPVSRSESLVHGAGRPVSC
jgi:isopentenyl-diphosphate delta-isomerase